MQLLYPQGGQSASGVAMAATRTALRFPVPAKAWVDARTTVQNFSAEVPVKPDFFHGRGDGSDPEDLNSCIHCGFQTHRYRSACPRCGGGTATCRWARRFGGMLTACGAVITALIALVSYSMVPAMLHPGKTMAGGRFTGTPAQALLFMAIFAAVAAFGLTALCYGIWQLKTGRRDKRVVSAMLAIWTVLLLVALVI